MRAMTKTSSPLLCLANNSPKLSLPVGAVCSFIVVALAAANAIAVVLVMVVEVVAAVAVLSASELAVAEIRSGSVFWRIWLRFLA